MSRLGTSVVALLVLAAAACSASKPSTPAAPAPGASPSLAAVGFISAPAGRDRHTVVEWGWDGRRIRTVRTDGVVDCCNTVTLSPDGTRLLVPGDPSGGEVLDVEGHVLARTSDGGQWADDSRHLCALRPHGPTHGLPDGPADLVLVDPGHGERVVASVLGYGPHAAPALLRCSVRDDEALVVENQMAMNTSIRAVRLSTGAVTTPSWAPASVDDGEVVAVSGNGRDALLQVSSSGARGEVVDTTTGAVLARTQGQPGDLSWDGHVVLETVFPDLRLRAVDWRTHSTRWISRPPPAGGPWPDASYALVARTGTDDVALAVTNQPREPYGEAELWILRAGVPVRVARAVRFGVV